MNVYRKYIACVTIIMLVAACSRNKQMSKSISDNQLSKHQQDEGWVLLFDGKSTDAWRGAFIDSFPAKGWMVKDGLLMVEPSDGGESTNGGDIVTKDTFSHFELMVDFKITEGANSGIKYFVDPKQPVPANPRSAFGLEFQVLDDAKHPDAKLGKNGNRKLGSLYDLIPAPSDKPARAIGAWNTARIVARGTKVEHWLNGIKILEYERGSVSFKQLISDSKYKDLQGFGMVSSGAILLQDHGNRVFFKNIKLRKLDTVRT